jgi:hypothetical protein
MGTDRQDSYAGIMFQNNSEKVKLTVEKLCAPRFELCAHVQPGMPECVLKQLSESF